MTTRFIAHPDLYDNLRTYSGWFRLYHRLKAATNPQNTLFCANNFNDLVYKCCLMLQSLTRLRFVMVNGMKRVMATCFGLCGMKPSPTVQHHADLTNTSLWRFDESDSRDYATGAFVPYDNDTSTLITNTGQKISCHFLSNFLNCILLLPMHFNLKI